MNRAFLSCVVFLATVRIGTATDFRSPSLDTLANSHAVYLVRVTSLKDAKGDVFSSRVNFSVTEVMKGKARTSLSLTPLFLSDFKKDSEYILYYTDSDFTDTVGWNGVEQVGQWLQLPVSHQDRKATVEKVGSLDKLRDYLREHP